MGLANVGRGAVQEAPWGGGSGADEKEEGDSFWGTHGGLWLVCSDGNEHRAMAVARCSVFFWSSVLLKGLGVLHVMHTRGTLCSSSSQSTLRARSKQRNEQMSL